MSVNPIFTVRIVYASIGGFFLALGFIGAFLPLLPTTPFVLLSGYFFARSNQRLHSWLVNSRLFGQLIKDWERHGVIPLRGKLLSLLGISLGLTISFVRTESWGIRALCIALGAIGTLYVWSKPSNPPREESPPF